MKNATDIKDSEGMQRVNNMKKVASGFKVEEKEYGFFRKLSFPKYSFYCDNDCFFDVNNLEQYSNSIDSKPILLHEGHFNTSNEYPEILQVIKDICLRKDN